VVVDEPVTSGDVLFHKDVRWDFVIGTWTAQDIQEYCVDDDEWQMFRKDLKGLPTVEKIHRLRGRYKKLVCDLPGGEDFWSPKQKDIWNRGKCQIDNYINALKRGGILDNNGYIKKP
jgi:hypothetical protein